jgi:hypothetical protein
MSANEEYLVGETITLQAEYFNTADEPLDADTTPTCEIHDSEQRAIQTNLPVTRVSQGKYAADFSTVGLDPGVYSYIFAALFDGKQSLKAGTFELYTA